MILMNLLGALCSRWVSRVWGEVMAKQAIRKVRGSLSSDRKGTPVVVRMQPPLLRRLERWIASQPEPRPSRAKAIRRLLERELP